MPPTGAGKWRSCFKAGRRRPPPTFPVAATRFIVAAELLGDDLGDLLRGEDDEGFEGEGAADLANSDCRSIFFIRRCSTTRNQSDNIDRVMWWCHPTQERSSYSPRPTSPLPMLSACS